MFGKTKLEAIIQRDTKTKRWTEDGFEDCDPFDVYFVVPSPAKGLTAKAGARIENVASDPIWQQIKLFAETGDRVVVAIDKGFANGTPVKVLSIQKIEE